LKVDEPKAYALTWDGENHIYIYLGLYNRIESRIISNFKGIEGESLSLINSLRKIEKTEPSFLIFQFVTLFIYYHELAHLNQNKLNNNLNNLAPEHINLVAGVKFNKIKHAIEIDADLFAAQHLTFHIHQLWSRLHQNDKTKENFESAISVISASLFILFHELSNGFQKFYTLDFTHPHSVIRVSYIVDCIISTANSILSNTGITIDYNKCIINCLSLSSYFISEKGVDGLGNYLDQFKIHKNEINEYVHANMAPFSKTISYLISNNY
jgi:hypothetical protein